MSKTAIYPGTFDPITYGHIDVIKKALKIVDHVVVAISDGSNKNYLFDIDERIEIVKKALFVDVKFKKNKINVISFKSLYRAFFTISILSLILNKYFLLLPSDIATIILSKIFKLLIITSICP